jgi:hypothetical protein
LQWTIACGGAPFLNNVSHMLIVAVGLGLFWRAFQPHARDQQGPALALAFVTGLVPCPLTTVIMTYAATPGPVFRRLAACRHVREPNDRDRGGVPAGRGAAVRLARASYEAKRVLAAMVGAGLGDNLRFGDQRIGLCTTFEPNFVFKKNLALSAINGAHGAAGRIPL